MSISIVANRYPAFIRRIVRWWRNWTVTGAALDDLRRIGPEEVERLAQDIGLTGSDLRTLAGKWPDSSELLSRRLAALKFDEHELARDKPEVLRDLQRVCTLCASKGRCEHDFAYRPSDPTWQAYCPNSQTLAALNAERARRSGPKAA
jgi:hypothetical protein